MTRRILVSVLCGWPALASADALTIEHKEVGCVASGKFPRLEARFNPPDAVARARLHFKPAGWPHWYSVPMKQEGAGFLGVLPKPDKKLGKFDYYISVVDRSFTESRTTEHTPIVVSGPGGCQQNKVLALGLKKAAQVIVSGPEGVLNAPLVPVGFSTDGVIAGAAGAAGGAPAASGAGAAGGVGAAGAAAGGGVSATVLVVGAVAVVGGGAAIASKAGSGGGGGGGGGSTTTQPPGATTTTVPPVTTAPAVPCPGCYAGIWEFRATTVACGPLCGGCSPGSVFVGSITVNADGMFRLPDSTCEPPSTIDAAGNVNFVLAGDTCPGTPPGGTCPAGTGTGRCSDSRTCAGAAEQGGEQFTWTMTKQ